MKHLRLTLRLDPEVAPGFFAYQAESADVGEVRVVDWNMAAPDAKTILYAVEGDGAGFAAAARETEGVESVAFADGDDVSFALVSVGEGGVPVFSAATGAIARAGLVVSKPMVYRGWELLAHAVGQPGALQTALDAVPAPLDLRVDEIGEYPCRRAAPTTTLSTRQREAIDAALELGYYDAPRDATCEDVAAELGCSTSTASEHLQKAEAKLVRAGADPFADGWAEASDRTEADAR